MLMWATEATTNNSNHHHHHNNNGNTRKNSNKHNDEIGCLANLFFATSPQSSQMLFFRLRQAPTILSLQPHIKSNAEMPLGRNRSANLQTHRNTPRWNQRKLQEIIRWQLRFLPKCIPHLSNLLKAAHAQTLCINVCDNWPPIQYLLHSGGFPIDVWSLGVPQIWQCTNANPAAHQAGHLSTNSSELLHSTLGIPHVSTGALSTPLVLS